MNLTDIVPVLPRGEQPTVHGAEARDTKATLDSVSKLRRMRLESNEHTVLDKMYERFMTTLTQQRADLLVKHGDLPSDLLRSSLEKDVLTSAASSPRATLSSLREIAEKLGFPIFPEEYLDERSLQKEKAEVLEGVTKFRGLKPWFDLYVIGPVGHYSVKKHVEAPDDKAIFAPTVLSQAMLALSMAIPMFRALSADMKEVRRDVNDLKGRQDKTQQELQNLANRVSMLEAEVARAKREEAFRRAEEAKRAADLERLRSLEVSMFQREEPLMLAVPKGIDVRSAEGWAILGPCWGPDFDDIVMAALGIARIEGARVAHVVAMKENWMPPPRHTGFWNTSRWEPAQDQYARPIQDHGRHFSAADPEDEEDADEAPKAKTLKSAVQKKRKDFDY